MDGFESKTLGRKFEKLVFGTLASGGATPAVGAGAKANPPPPANIKVDKATGKEARTVAEIFAAKAALKDQPVVVRGQVVKFNEGILGKNWIHLKDGTGAAGSDDLTITTLGKAAVGDVVTLRGVVHLDKDFGAGYAYGVIVEDASVEKGL